MFMLMFAWFFISRLIVIFQIKVEFNIHDWALSWMFSTLSQSNKFVQKLLQDNLEEKQTPHV